MLIVLRIVVMWLIALAIPLQGMAAVAMPPCPPAHHPDMSAAFDQLVEQADAVGPMAVAADHAMHDGVAASQDDGDPVEAAGLSGHSGHSGHSMLKCCSAACAMAAVVTSDLALQLHARSPAPLHPVAQFYRGAPPDGLDRPPKPVLA
jgi:hypothetical protein